MKSKYNLKISLNFTEFHLIVVVIAVFHMLIMNTFIEKSKYWSDQEEVEVAEIQKQEEEQELSIEEKLMLLREKKIYGIVYIGDQKLFQKNSLSEFLKTNDNVKAQVQNLDKFTNFIGFSDKKVKKQYIDSVVELSEHEKKALAFKLLKRKVAKYKHCYHQYQKVDHLLEGFVDVSVITTSRGPVSNVKFNGVGQSRVIANLEGCIQNELAKIEFPSQLSGNRFKLKITL